ncbi:MAG: NADH-quinone oxidoreductase subunit A [Phycisphaerae bacterium]
MWPLAVYCGAVLLLVGGMLGLSFFLGQRHRQRATDQQYESGMVPTGGSRLRFAADFYLVAIFFVVFDLEIVLFVSWAIAIRQVGWGGFVQVLVISAALIAAWIYLWRVGALDWGSSARSARRDRKAGGPS